mmetsp:Transcript_78293/g.227068  ORF Transcript_78293/g.227068 Transcript_78293/m.227068 type:complete len:428 (-) Transcript_78293:430-1713(-)
MRLRRGISDIGPTLILARLTSACSTMKVPSGILRKHGEGLRTLPLGLLMEDASCVAPIGAILVRIDNFTGAFNVLPPPSQAVRRKARLRVAVNTLAVLRRVKPCRGDPCEVTHFRELRRLAHRITGSVQVVAPKQLVDHGRRPRTAADSLAAKGPLLLGLAIEECCRLAGRAKVVHRHLTPERRPGTARCAAAEFERAGPQEIRPFRVACDSGAEPGPVLVVELPGSQRVAARHRRREVVQTSWRRPTAEPRLRHPVAPLGLRICDDGPVPCSTHEVRHGRVVGVSRDVRAAEHFGCLPALNKVCHVVELVQRVVPRAWIVGLPVHLQVQGLMASRGCEVLRQPAVGERLWVFVTPECGGHLVARHVQVPRCRPLPPDAALPGEGLPRRASVEHIVECILPRRTGSRRQIKALQPRGAGTRTAHAFS